MSGEAPSSVCGAQGLRHALPSERHKETVLGLVVVPFAFPAFMLTSDDAVVHCCCTAHYGLEANLVN